MVQKVGQHSAGKTALSILLAACVALLAACTAILNTGENLGEPDVLEKVRSVDLLPRSPTQPPNAELATGRRVKPAIYPAEPADADGAQISASAQPLGTANGEGVELNFENTPVASVAKIVLGDMLRVGYVIDPRVQGTVSLASGRPVPRSDVIFVLENALRLSGVALIRDNAVYRLMPQADAVGAGAADTAEQTEPGYGISVVPLQYVSAQTLLKLVDSFVTKPGMVRADGGRNLILIQGSGTERRNAVNLVLSFDADWMRGQSVGIFPVQYSNPEPIIAELEKIVDAGEGGVGHGVVKFQPIGRMNAVLAVTRKPEVLRQIETWIQRLDNIDTGRSAIHVYRIKYGDARQIARVLNDIFIPGGTGSSSTLDSAAGQIAPGSGMASSSSGGSALNRLSAGQSNQSSGGFGSSSRSGSSGAYGGSQTGLASNMQAGNMFDNRGGGLFGARGAAGGGATGVLEGVRITADAANNSLLIYASREQYSIIERSVRQVDRPQLQVAIDATIAEVTLTDDLSFGVQFYLTNHNLGLKPNGSLLNTASTRDPLQAAASATGAAANAFINRAFPGFNFLVGSETQPNAILNALHAVTDVNVLSTPSIVAVDNQVATLQVGDEIPIQTGSATVLSSSNTVATTTDYRSTGIILRVVPRINVNGNVRLDIEQEISNPVPNSANPLTPTVATRKVQSSVAVASGQTVLLAGLISSTQNRGRNGIPVLDQIPVLGELFTQTGKSIKRTELIIFIRPQIIRDSQDAYFVAEELRSKLRGTIGSAGSSQATPPKYRGVKYR